MIVTFYGVRGSVPTPGPETLRFGGNTSCVHVRLEDGRDFIFDAGTGLRPLGAVLRERREPIVILSTHSHWDHIQGFPFFEPIFQPERDIAIIRPIEDREEQRPGILEQMNGTNFPVPAAVLPSRVRYEDDLLACLGDGDATVERKPLNHSGGGSAFKLNTAGATLAYVTDNELVPPETPVTSWSSWVDWLRGVDVMIHDAQYVEADMPGKHGWGHSLISQVRQLALDAEVGCLCLYHHDPTRTDADLQEVRIESERWFRQRGARTQVVVSFEGLSFEISGSAPEGQRVRALSALRP